MRRPIPTPGPGRNTKLTPELQDIFCAKLRKTLPVDKACDLVGIDRESYYNWMERGERAAPGDEIYARFFGAVTKARAEAQEFWLDILANSAVERSICPKAAFFVLERSDRQNWGRVERQEVEQTVKVDPKSLSDALKEIESEGD